MERTRFVIEFIDQDALDQFKALPKATQKTIGTAMKDRLEIDPVSFGKPLRYSLKASAHKPEVKTPRSGDPLYLNFMVTEIFRAV